LSDLKAVFARVDALTRMYARRDSTANMVRAVRKGDFDDVSPGIFPEDWPRPVVSNLIDVMARDYAAKLAPLPAINCTASSSLNEKAKAFADKRTKIANNYIISSRLSPQMPDAADSFNCYGLLAMSVEPDFDEKSPRIRVEDGVAIYPVWNRNMETVAYAKVYYRDHMTLIADYPELAAKLERHKGAIREEKIKVVKFQDKTQTVVYLPECGNEVLESYPNIMGRCTLVAVPRPNGNGTFSGHIAGAYDDLIWPQLARNEFQILAMEAADKAVRAPIVVPPDVTDISFGPDATIRTSNPAGVQRLRVDVPPSSFQAMQWLRDDMQVGGMSPESRQGQQSASVITGRGVQELMDGYSTQIALAQEMVKFALEQVIRLCFAMDEKLWPNVSKEIRGQDSGVPFKITYTPKKDIDKDHAVDVQYGFLAGLDANRALVYVLQAQGAGLLSRDFAMRQFPANINVAEEAKKIELERMRDSLIQALSATGQSLPQLIANGQDPSPIVRAIAAVTDNIKKGKPIEQVIVDVFAPPQPPAPADGAPGAPTSPDAGPGGPDAGAAGGGFGGEPLKQGIATEGPNGRPDLQTLFAGLNGSGTPNLKAGISRMNPVMGQ